jgi:hypothetical protein
MLILTGSVSAINTMPTSPQSRGNILYVGGSGPRNYTRIQDAIDNATNRDTVYVYTGLYDEHNIIINKSINLIGENKDTTVIDGGGHHDTVRIEADHVTISGFTIEDDGDPDFYRIGIVINYPSRNIDIHDNIITKNYMGISIYSTDYSLSNISIYDNFIINNKNGIDNVGQDHANIKIYNNIISDNELGVDAGHNYSIYENQITHNNIGLSASASHLTYIYHNNIKDNAVGIKTYNFQDAHIYENNFINNKIHASVSRQVLISEIKILRTVKQNWTHNYWDKFIKLGPKPIIGLQTLFILVWFGVFRPFPFPIALIPYIEFDWHPAQEPYEIGGVV